MTEHRVPGRSLVTRRALVDIIRPAVAGSYGVTGFVSRTFGERVLGWLGLADPGIQVSLREGLSVDLYLTVAFGLPVAEVARQADSAVRYSLHRALGREVERLTIHVAGMRYQPAPLTFSAAAPDPGPGEKTRESLALVDKAVAAAVDDGGNPR